MAVDTRVDPNCNVPVVVMVDSSIASNVPPVPKEKAPDELRSNKTLEEVADKIKPEAI